MSAEQTPSPTRAQLERLRHIAEGAQYRTRSPRFGPYRGARPLLNCELVRRLREPGWIEWKEATGEDPVLVKNLGPSYIAVLTDAGRAAIAKATGAVS